MGLVIAAGGGFLGVLILYALVQAVVALFVREWRARKWIAWSLAVPGAIVLRALGTAGAAIPVGVHAAWIAIYVVSGGLILWIDYAHALRREARLARRA